MVLEGIENGNSSKITLRPLVQGVNNCVQGVNNCVDETIALNKFSGQLWYLSEGLVALAFLTKRCRWHEVTNGCSTWQKSGWRSSQMCPKKRLFKQLLGWSYNKKHPSLLPKNENGSKASNRGPWLMEWSTRLSDGRKLVQGIQVTSDTAERGVALIHEYNRLVMDDEDQLHFLM